MRYPLLSFVILLGLPACEGPRGPQGEPGPSGEALPDGGPSDGGPAGGDSAVADAAVVGLSGQVLDGTGRPLARGAVVLLPAAVIAELSEAPIASEGSGPELADAIGDEPIEDALDALDPTAARAVLSGSGRFAFAELPAGDAFFLVFVPDPEDEAHLPGGELARSAIRRESLSGAELSLRVSGAPTAAARYVGSGPCLQCHGRHSLYSSAHRVGLTRPAGLGAAQDKARFPGVDGLAPWVEAGAVLVFSECDSEPSERARCRVTEDGAASDPWFEVALGIGEAGAWTVTLRNQRGPGEQTYPVALRYGGALGRQQLLLDVASSGETPQLVPAPFAWNLRGDPSAVDPADYPFVVVEAERFYDFAAEALRTPAATDSFGLQCAGCHYTGYALSGDAEAGFVARAVASPGGAFDADADGRLDEINVGCESCHGPGSEHLEAPERGAHIVAPGLLTAARASLICGACHGRVLGRADGASHAPLDSAGRMPRPGIRRADFLRQHVSQVPAAESDLWPSGDARRHFQQYDELIRSTKHRNGLRLVACDDCHDVHNASGTESELLAGGGDALCAGCHSAESVRDLSRHTERATGEDHTVANQDNMGCVDCHMPQTGLRGARRLGLRDLLPLTAEPYQYYHGDVSSHGFRRYTREEAEIQPTPFTAACATCHGQWLDQP